MSLPKTKKQFKEELSHHHYGRGRSRIHGIYYDWKFEREQGCGFKYMLLAWDVTKKEAIDMAWDLFHEPKNRWNYMKQIDLLIANDMSERCKVPISVNQYRDNFSSPYKEKIKWPTA